VSAKATRYIGHKSASEVASYKMPANTKGVIDDVGASGSLRLFVDDEAEHDPGAKVRVRKDAMVQLLRNAGHLLHVLRLLEDGAPSHPLARGKGFIPRTTRPTLWSVA
jgi:hypothetical protein